MTPITHGHSIMLAAVLLGVAILYAGGWFRLEAVAKRENRSWRPVAFCFGFLLFWAGLESPLSTMDHESLTAHMTKHLLLMTIAPALILVAKPIAVISRGLPQRFAEQVLSGFRLPIVRRIGRFLANPIVCWSAATTVLVGWHVPAIFTFGMSSTTVHAIEDFSFVCAGFLFWWPVLHPWTATLDRTRWLMIVYLFLATLPCDILSAYLTFCDRVVYTHYLHLPGATTMSVLRDQEFAGALMWTCVTIIYLIPASILTVRLLSPVGPSGTRNLG